MYQFLSLDQISSQYGFSKPTVLKIKREAAKYNLELLEIENKPSKILNNDHNHKIFEGIRQKNKHKWKRVDTVIEADWSRLIDHEQASAIPMELYSEITQYNNIPKHVHHESKGIMEILDALDYAHVSELDQNNSYSNLLITTFEKVLSDIEKNKIAKINIIDLNFQLAYPWPKIWQKLKKIRQIQKYIPIDMSLVRLKAIIDKIHPQLKNWPDEAINKIKISSIEAAGTELKRSDLLRALYQSKIFTEKDDTSSIHFVSDNHLYSRSIQNKKIMLNNICRSMDSKDFAIIFYKNPKNMTNDMSLTVAKLNKESGIFTAKNILGLQENIDYVICRETNEDKMQRHSYLQMQKNIEIHFGRFKNSFVDIDFDRKLVLSRGQKLLFSQREYIGRKEMENLLEEVGFDIEYFNYDSNIETGVFVCKVKLNN